MAKIVINIDMDELTSGINQVVDDDMYEMEEEFVCPSFNPRPREECREP